MDAGFYCLIWLAGPGGKFKVKFQHRPTRAAWEVICYAWHKMACAVRTKIGIAISKGLTDNI